MSKLFTMAIVAALLAVPSAAVIRADEANSETKQACDKECCQDGACMKECCKEGKCKEGCDKKECCKDGACKEACNKGECEAKTAKCTKCKCENCSNAQCDTDNCTCAASKTCDSKCEGGACCDQAVADGGGLDFQTLTLVVASATGECASGKCCKSNCSDKSCCKDGKNCCDAAKCVAGECREEGTCCDSGIAGCIDGSVLHWNGNSIFAVTIPSPTSIETVDTLRWAAYDWDLQSAESACREEERVRVSIASAAEEATKAVSAAYVQTAPSTTASTCRCSATESVQSPGAVQYSIQVVEDRGECFKEFDWQGNGGNLTYVETKSLAPTIRTLEKHQLIRRVSPKITCTNGQQAELEVNSGTAEEPKQLKIQVLSQVIENDQLVVQLGLRPGDDQQRAWCTAFTPEPGKTFVLNTAGPAADGDEEQQANQPAIFIVVTSEAAK